MQEIFISYSRADSDFGKKLHQGLTQAGHEPWMDWINIPPSSHWWQEIQEGIEAAATFVFVISPDSIASPVCQLEIAHARLCNKRIIPVLYRETVEKEALKRIEERELGTYLETLIQKEEIIALARANWIELAQINWITFTNLADYEKQLRTLVDAIDTDLDYVKAHTRLQVRSLEWEKEDRRDDLLLRGMDLAHAQEWLAKASESLQPAPTELQETFIKASAADEKTQQTKRKRLKNGIILIVLALIILPYLWLSTRFYLDTSNSGGGLVVRAGDPGLKILPGFDFAAIGTDYSLSDIADPYISDVTNEQIQGFWIPSKAWGEKIYPLLKPSQSGLAYWRIGQHDKAFTVLGEAVKSGDLDSVKTLTYLALLDPPDINQLVDRLLPALGGSEEMRQVGLESFEYLRRVSPDVASTQAERLLDKPNLDPTVQVWAIEASGILAENPNKALEGVVDLFSAGTTKTIQSSANAFAAIVLRGQQVQPAQIDEAIQQAEKLPAGPQETVLKAILGLELSDRQKEMLQRIFHEKLSSQVSKEQIFAMQGLSDLNSDDPLLFLQSIDRLQHDPDKSIRAALPDLLLKLSHHEPARSFDLLASLALSDSSEFVRYDALQSFHGWFGYDHDIVLKTLVQAGGDGSDLVRIGSLEEMINLELETSCCLDGVENALASKLDDESFQVRLTAAQGLLLLSNRIENPEHLSLAAQIFSQALIDPSQDNSRPAQKLAERYTNPKAIIITGELLMPYLRDADSFKIYTYTTFFDKALENQPQAIPSISLLLSPLLQKDEIKGDVWYFIWQIHQQNPGARTQTLSAYMDQLQSGDKDARQNILEALSILGTLDREIATEALQVISPYQNNDNPDLRASAFEAIGIIAKKYPDLVEGDLPSLLDCLKTSSGVLQISCSIAILDYAEAEDNKAAQLTGDLFQIMADSAMEPDVRISVAKSLIFTSGSANKLSEVEGEGLIRQISEEQDDITKYWLAGVLAAYGNPDTGQVDYAISFLTQQAMSAEVAEREEIVMVLLSLGQQRPLLSEKVIQAMGAFVSDPEYAVRASSIIAIREVGLVDIHNARLGLESLLPALTSQQDNIRWEAVANGVAPLQAAYPELAARVVEVLDLSYQVAIEDTDSFSSLSEIQTNQILAYGVLGEGTPDLLWPMITSTNYDTRYVGRAAMVRVLKTRPEMMPLFQEELANLQKGCQPHECLSVSLANEMTVLLQNSRFMKILQEEGSEIQLIDWLPSYIGVNPLGN